MTYVILYLARRGDEDVVEIRQQASPSLEHAIAIATNAVRNMVFSRGKGHAIPVGFSIESADGTELHRWYDDAARQSGLK